MLTKGVALKGDSHYFSKTIMTITIITTPPLPILKKNKKQKRKRTVENKSKGPTSHHLSWPPLSPNDENSVKLLHATAEKTLHVTFTRHERSVDY